MAKPIYSKFVQTSAGAADPSASFTVVNEETGLDVDIYSDRAGTTVITPPYFADSSGLIRFYYDEGITIRIAVTGASGSFTDRYQEGRVFGGEPGNSPRILDFQVDSISQLPPATGSGRKVSVTGYYDGTTVGGDPMVDAGSARHNGITLFDPNRAGEIGTAAYYVDSGSDANCWERIAVEYVSPDMGGGNIEKSEEAAAAAGVPFLYDFDLEKNRTALNRFLRYAHSTGANKCQPIYIVGDSITEGTDSTNFATDGYAALLRTSVQRAFNHRNYGFANFDFDVPQSVTQPHVVTKNGFFGTGGGGSAFNDAFYGGVMIQNSAAGHWVKVQFTGKDLFLVYGQDPAGGILDVHVDGVLVGDIDTSQTPVQKIAGTSQNGTFSTEIVTSEWGDHEVMFVARSSAPCKLCGVCYFEDVATTLNLPTVFNVGRSSIRLSDIPDDILQGYMNSGTVIFSLGVNDELTSAPISGFNAKLEYVFSGMAAIDGGIIVNDFIFNDDQENEYKTALRNKADFYKLPFFDFAKLWFSDTTTNVFSGLLDSDTVHPTDAGHLNIARTIASNINLPFHKEPFKSKNITREANINLIPTYVVPETVLNDNIVHLNFVATNGTGGVIPQDTLLATIADGFRPKSTLLVSITTATVASTVEIRTNGEIRTAFGWTIPAGDWFNINVSYSLI